MEFGITPFTAADWPQVRTIYLEGIATGEATFETEAPSWEQWDSNHLLFARLAARSGDTILGWAALSAVSKRKVYAGVAEVTVYVGARYRGIGVGSALLQALIADSERQGIWTLQGATFPENVASLRLQESCGFRIVGRRERIGCMNGKWRDTILMERRSSLPGPLERSYLLATHDSIWENPAVDLPPSSPRAGARHAYALQALGPRRRLGRADGRGLCRAERGSTDPQIGV